MNGSLYLFVRMIAVAVEAVCGTNCNRRLGSSARFTLERVDCAALIQTLAAAMEINPIKSEIMALQARFDALRGYL